MAKDHVTKGGWATKFDDLIILPDGRKLMTLRDAASYVTKLPKTEQNVDKWQIAVGMLIKSAEIGGPWLMMARMGFLRALYRNVQPVFNTDRKETRWGKRKLKRDE